MNSPDHRAAPRHRPHPVRVHLLWKEETELHHAVALVRDLSRGGVGIAVDAPAHPRGPVFLALEGSSLPQWVRAEVAEVVPTGPVERRVGLKFPEICPGRFFRSVLQGGATMAAEPVRSATDPDSCWSRRSKRSRESILGRDLPRDSRWLPDDSLLPTVEPAPLVGVLH